MTVSLTTIRQGIADRAALVSGLMASITPGSVLPAAVVVPGSGVVVNYDTTLDGACDITLAVQLFVSKAVDGSAYEKLDAYLSPDGPDSVKVAIEGDMDLDGEVHYVSVVEARNYGQTDYAGVECLACELVVTVAA